MDHILDVSNQTSPGDDKTPPYTSGAEIDFVAESALGLLSAMFGEANANWGGAESVDWDLEMAGADTDVSHVYSGPLQFIDFEVASASYREKESMVDKKSEATPAPVTTGWTQLSTQKKLRTRSRFGKRRMSCWRCVASCPSQAPLASFTGFSLSGHFDLDSVLDLDVDTDLNESQALRCSLLCPRPVVEPCQPPCPLRNMGHSTHRSRFSSRRRTTQGGSGSRGRRTRWRSVLAGRRRMAS